MAEAQRLIGISLAKIAQSRVCRGGVSLHKNLLVATVLQKARYIFMEEAYHIVHGHYLQQQQQQHHHQLLQEQQNAAYLLASHCDSSSPSSDSSCEDDSSSSSKVDEKSKTTSSCSVLSEEELVDPVEEEEDESSASGAVSSYDCDSAILPTTIPLEPLNMCRNGSGVVSDRQPSSGCYDEEDEEEDEKEQQQHLSPSHLFLLPALAPWISASEDKENSNFSFLPSPFDQDGQEDEEEDDPEEPSEEEDEDEEEENTCQDLSCHQRKPPAAVLVEHHQQQQTPELVKQIESAVRSKGAMRYFDLGERTERRRRRHRTEGDHQDMATIPTGGTKRRRSSTNTSEWEHAATCLSTDSPDISSSAPSAALDDDRVLPIALLSAKRMKTGDEQQAPQHPRPLVSASPQPQFYSSPHETICPGDAERLSECVNQQLEAENLSTSAASGHGSEVKQHDQEEAGGGPPTPSVESIDRITSLVSIFSFGNLSRSVSTPDFCSAQAQKDRPRPDTLSSQLQHHGQRASYLTMTV